MVEKQFFNGKNMNDIGKRAHNLKHSYGRCVVGFFDEILHEDYIWTIHRYVLSFILHKSIFLHFVHHGTRLYYRSINPDDRKYILMMMGVVFFQNRSLESFIMQNISIHMLIEVMFFPNIK